MNRIVMAGLVSVLIVPGWAFGYTQEDANEDAVFIWTSGCTDFKSGMNAGDFRGWLKPWQAAKTFKGIKSTAANNLYMDGWETARGKRGIISCEKFAPARAGAYTSGIDIRQDS